MIISVIWVTIIQTIEAKRKRSKERNIIERKNEIRDLKQNGRKSDSRKIALFLRIGKLYEEINDYRNAIKYYSKAISSAKEGTLVGTENRVEELKRQEDKRATIICENCNKINTFGNLKCKNCNKWMLSQNFNYIRENASVFHLIIAALLISSALIISFNLNLFRNIIFYALIFINLNVLDSILKDGWH